MTTENTTTRPCLMARLGLGREDIEKILAKHFGDHSASPDSNVQCAIDDLLDLLTQADEAREIISESLKPENERRTWEDNGHFSDCLKCQTTTDGQCSDCGACCCLDCLHEHECYMPACNVCGQTFKKSNAWNCPADEERHGLSCSEACHDQHIRNTETTCL